MSSSTGKSNLGSGADLIDAKLEEHQQLCGSKHCPGCGHKLQAAKPDWLGLPAGVKFDPTDQELIEHLEAKVEGKDIKSHPLIDEFIPTIEGEDGICYTHPEKLPGVTRDGLSRHFFHRPSKAYTTGTRKRRKIQTECDQLQAGGETRWHKTGKTRPVMVNGKQKGCKKILVLYTNFGKNRKPEKTNWVMHQYHLGQHEEEKEGELVVSKIFYQTQPRQCNWSDRTNLVVDSGSGSCSSSREIGTAHTINREDHVSGMAAALSSSYGLELDHHHHHQLKSDHFGFPHLINTKGGFDEVGIGEPSVAREGPDHGHGPAGGTCEDQHHVGAHDHHHHLASAAFHVSHPSHPISTIIPPPPLHHASVNILEDDSFNVARLMHLPNETFRQHQQPQQQQQQHHKMGGRSASGLEELIMGCTSSDIKEESAGIANPQEAEWLKYSTFWPDPSNNQDHHHHHHHHHHG